MPIVTAQTVILEALCDLGVIRPGETPSATVLTDCLTRLNQRIEAHSIEQLMAQTQLHATFSLQSGLSRYTFGVGGTFSTASRPEKVTGWRANNGSFQSGGAILTFEELQTASRDALGSTTSLPQAVGADTSFPLINVAVFPVPGASPATLELSYWIALQSFTSLLDAHTLPDGWSDFLHFDLAVALLPRYGRKEFDPTTLAANAQTSKGKLADLNRSTQQAPPQGS